ncbi:MAG: chromate transporter [Atribacterota bacterium]|jgi:chromate transporter|nr:chromate transporter [Atribacterota bacterium]
MKQGEVKYKENNILLLDIFITFFRIGLLTLGGGLAMSPVMRYELVLKKKWMSESDFSSTVALATIVPGSISVNIAYLLGRRLKGWKGITLSVLGVVLPSFITILLIASILLPFFHYPKVVNFLRGCAIAVVGQLCFASLLFSKRLIRRLAHIVICVMGILIMGVIKLHPIFGLAVVSTISYWFYAG